MKKIILAVVAIAVIAALLYGGWLRHSRKVSPLAGKPAPAFVLPQLQDPAKYFSPNDMKGKVWLLNVWGSWCGKCIEELPVLQELARQNIVPIYGLNYKDKRENALDWLERHGNPYTLSISDFDGRIAVDYGVQGVPITYVIDKQGVIQYGMEGEVTSDTLKKKILPLIAELEKK